MKFISAAALVLLPVWAASCLAQIADGPKFRVEILASDASPQFSVTNLSGRTLTACTIEFAVSTEARPQGKMNWDPLVQGRGPKGEAQGPLVPGQSVTLFMPHKVGAPLPDKVEVIAGIWADGQMSARVQSSQRGRRAMQMRRPCQISRCESIVHSRCGKSRIRACSIDTGSVSFVRRRRSLRRAT